MGITWKFRVTTASGMVRKWDPQVGALVEVRVPGEVLTVEQSGASAEDARSLCAHQWRRPIDDVKHVLDATGQPVHREYDDPPASVRSLRARARDGEDGLGR